MNRLLLDTQIALWWLTGNPRLKRAARDRLAAAECVVSVASVWEVAIKHRIGKLPVAPEIFAGEMRAGGAILLPVNDAYAVAYGKLPAGHDDPFDLLLLATAQAERLCLITSDEALFEFGTAIGALSIEKP